MELLVASGIGVLFAAGIYLLLRARTFPVVVGITLLSYGVNAMLFGMGRLATRSEPVLSLHLDSYSDPLPQALVLTAIVIAFGMTAFVVVLLLRTFLEIGSDHVDGVEPGDRRLPMAQAHAGTRPGTAAPGGTRRSGDQPAGGGRR